MGKRSVPEELSFRISVHYGAVWLLSDDHPALVRVDPATHSLSRLCLLEAPAEGEVDTETGMFPFDSVRGPLLSTKESGANRGR